MILIAGSLACAIGQFVSILILLVLIFSFGFFRDYIPGANNSNKKFAILTIHSSIELSLESIIERLVKEVGVSASPVSVLQQDSINTYVVNLSRFDKADTQKVIREIYLMDKKAKVNIFFPENQYGVN